MFLSGHILVVSSVNTLLYVFSVSEVTGYAQLDDSSSWWSDEDMDTPSSFHTLCQAFVAALGLGPCILVLDGINDISSTSGLSQQEVRIYSTALCLWLGLGPCILVLD